MSLTLCARPCRSTSWIESLSSGVVMVGIVGVAVGRSGVSGESGSTSTSGDGTARCGRLPGGPTLITGACTAAGPGAALGIATTGAEAGIRTSPRQCVQLTCCSLGCAST